MRFLRYIFYCLALAVLVLSAGHSFAQDGGHNCTCPRTMHTVIVCGSECGYNQEGPTCSGPPSCQYCSYGYGECCGTVYSLGTNLGVCDGNWVPPQGKLFLKQPNVYVASCKGGFVNASLIESDAKWAQRVRKSQLARR